MKRPKFLKLPRTKKGKALILLLIIGLAGLTYSFFSGSGPAAKVPVPGQTYHSKLTGQEVSREASTRPILGVMIENSEEARPQTGLDSAGIVFETVTEAGITRYLALYQDNFPEEVGPVRSVRPYFVDWVMGLDASVAHVGGSDEALSMLEDRKGKSMNEFYNGESYYRRSDREAPHNAYAKTKDLRALQEEKGHKPSTFNDFPRSSDAPNATPTASLISLSFSHPIFDVTFSYDKATNLYSRSLALQPHLDAATNKPITVKNVVVLKMAGDINALSSGEGTLYKDGILQAIKWEQTSYTSRLKLTDAQGNEVALNRGDTWVAILPGSGTVTQQ